MTIHETKKAVKDELLSKANVNSVGIGKKIEDGVITGELAIRCRVSQKVSAKRLRKKDLIPVQIGDYPTDVIESAMPKTLRTTVHRPAPGGVSVGHKDITAGTLGCWVWLNDGRIGILSNHHVLVGNTGKIGDLIVQPGPYDIGGQIETQHHIGHLDSFVPIAFEDVPPPSSCPFAKGYVNLGNWLAGRVGSNTRLSKPVLFSQATANLVDAAVAFPISSNFMDAKILDIGYVTERHVIAVEDIGATVKKSGRTTGYTEGVVEEIDVSVRVSYGNNNVALMEDQIVANNMAAGGDSGSLGVMTNNSAFGLLFAGSDTSTIFCRLENIFNLLNIEAICA